jgi:hypothetical protein
MQKVTVTLTPQELGVLQRQHPSTKTQGGFQNLLVTLQQKVEQPTGAMTLSIADIERIRRYAFEYGNGGWEKRLLDIFERTLGPQLDSPKAA